MRLEKGKKDQKIEDCIPTWLSEYFDDEVYFQETQKSKYVQNEFDIWMPALNECMIVYSHTREFQLEIILLRILGIYHIISMQ